MPESGYSESESEEFEEDEEETEIGEIEYADDEDELLDDEETVKDSARTRSHPPQVLMEIAPADQAETPVKIVPSLKFRE